MFTTAKLSARRNFGLFIVVLVLLVGGTWAAVKFTTDYLLHENATSVARNWARYLTENVTDLEQIAAGEQPSAASMAFFSAASKAGQVFRYEIFNRDGFSQLVSNRNSISLVDLSEFSADAARSIMSAQPIVAAKNGRTAGFPSFFAEAYVPIVSNQRPIAVVAAYVDQTEQRDTFARAFLITAASLCLLIAFAFGLPAIAWYRRTKEKHRADQRIRFLAHHDVLTGLANRARLMEKLDDSLASTYEGKGQLAVHLLDLDRFKAINDTLGHDGGDALLTEIAKRLRSVVRADDLVARLGGDEFVVVQANIGGRADAENFARRILTELATPLQFKASEIACEGSIGIALAPTDGKDPDRLLKSADLALFKGKEEGRNCIRFFEPEMDAALVARLTLEKRIRDAVTHDGFVLHYQPIFEMSEHRLIGFEALVRLTAEDGSLIPPAMFIPAAEEMRLIDRIGAWVLREACRSACAWPSHLTVSVNLSPIQFSAGSVSQLVATALAETGLDPARLELEITENVLLGDGDAVMLELEALKAIGVAIVMDDFGTGYSSLSYLWRFPFDKIKIDRSFMQEFEGSTRDAGTVVKTIIALGRELDMRVTVEGVETAEQVEFLDKADADQVQGFFFGRPVAGTELAAQILASLRSPAPIPALESAVVERALVSDGIPFLKRHARVPGTKHGDSAGSPTSHQTRLLAKASPLRVAKSA
jgi:diguanylate cyclase (GGDEF)-like protein